jgi:PDZ domain-containing protein
VRWYLGVAVVLIGAITILQHVGTNYYTLTPGNATSVAPLVKISGLATKPHPDRILLTDVYLSSSPLSEWQWIISHFQSHVEYVTTDELLSPGIPTDQLAAQGYLEMSDSQQSAEVAALRALGWHIPEAPEGAVVNGVGTASPALRAHLHVADRVVGVDGLVVATSCDLIADVHHVAPGTVVRLSVERSHISAAGVITWSAPSTMKVTAGPPSRSQGSSGCAGVNGPARSWLGIALEDGFRYRLPATISINTANIGGPSAGLAMTLTIIDKLSAGSLTGHTVIAATGTIDAAGNIGAIGGVAEKTVAAQRAGARVFLVPAGQNYVDARAASQPGLKIIAVQTLRGALRALRSLGGAAPVPLTSPH